MCDTSVVAAMSKQIQNACQEFPKAAAQIALQYGLESQDFNDLEEKMRKDSLFRYRVKREVVKVSKTKKD